LKSGEDDEDDEAKPRCFKSFIVFTVFKLALVIVFSYLPKTSSTAE